MDWKKSSFCKADSPMCVEVKKIEDLGTVVVRNNRNPGDQLDFTDEEWDAFIKGVKAGEFD